MKIRRAELVGLGFVLLGFAAVAAFYDRLPERVPTHWNADGVANGFMPKPWGALLMPLVMTSVWVLFLVLPRVSPRGYRIERFQVAYDLMHLALLAFFWVLSLFVLLVGSGVPIPMGRAIPFSVGVLLIVIGNFMGKLTKNFFVGIRTPWTLANDEVWLRTHRLGGKLFVVAGLGLAISGFFGGGSVPIFAAAFVAAGIPIAYSYFLYRKLER
jgi:uncharacterized membrane protein